MKSMLRFRLPAGRSGQILIPSLMFFPVFFVFAALLFETVKLSREKIRHQMGLDAGAYAEMSNLTDYVNRTAYVNGAFPFRIFKESWNCSDCPYCMLPPRNPPGGDCLYDLEAKHYGAFPITPGDSDQSDSARSWNIAYRAAKRSQGAVQLGRLSLMDDGDAAKQARTYDYPCDNNQSPQPGPDDILNCGVKNPYPVYSAWKTYSWYVTVYSTLGAVQDSQKTVYEAIASGSKFLKRGYYLNTGAGFNGGSLPKISTKKNTVDSIFYACNIFQKGNPFYPCASSFTQPPPSVNLF
ncbi:MAG TPA: hypothetical protein PLL10_10240, partial [Elusimicrobiales bacterium]|nr:hypothetical protein [Elusimicrobiales bacterium]